MLQDILKDLQQSRQLIIIPEEVDPDLVMAAIHLKVYRLQGPAVYFSKVKNSRYPAVSNLFGTVSRSRYLFRNTWDLVEKAIELRNQPAKAVRQPFRYMQTGISAIKALPKKVKWLPGRFDEIKISDLPQIRHWGKDGGAFITLPQVFSLRPGMDRIQESNLGMYRVQLSGNDYQPDEEIGLHYQIHRGIGVHHTLAKAQGKNLKVSIFIGGHPAHTLSAVMPLPEGMSELVFGGLLAGRRFRYALDHYGNVVSMDADFVITGEISPGEVKPEGPFGDHLGYYSWVHDFPVMKVNKVYAKKNAVWPFTVVGRPPQEDTVFGHLIHELTGSAIRKELPGIREVHAVDEAGVHPLLLAIGSERYTPYLRHRQPAELLTQANHILGTGQLSLAKYLFIAAPEAHSDEALSTYNYADFFKYVWSRIDLARDLHFQTSTTIDTLDYTGGKLNEGSKIVLAVHGPELRSLGTKVTDGWSSMNVRLISDGMLALSMDAFSSHEKAQSEMEHLTAQLSRLDEEERSLFPLLVVCDDAAFLAKNMDNFLWVTFTRSDPARDIYGYSPSMSNKHWGCAPPMIIDARMKPYMPPVLEIDPEVEKEADRILAQYWKEYAHLKSGLAHQ